MRRKRLVLPAQLWTDTDVIEDAEIVARRAPATRKGQLFVRQDLAELVDSGLFQIASLSLRPAVSTSG